jgi:hypothetical protein
MRYGGQQRQPPVVGVVDGEDLLELRALTGVQAELEDDVELHDAVVVQVAEVGLLRLLRDEALEARAAERGGHELRETIA